MSALENAKKLSQEEVINKTAFAGLREAGAVKEPVETKWKTILAERDEESMPLRIVAALNNNDTRHVYLELIDSSADKILSGMAIAAYAVGAEGIYLQLPEGEEKRKEAVEAKAKEMGIEVEVSLGLVNKRAYAGSPIHHIATMISLADIFDDSYEPGTYVAVGTYENYGELKKVPFGTRVGDLIEQSEDEIKAIEVGTKLYDAATGLNVMLEESTPVSAGTITVITNDCCIIQEAEKRLLEQRKTSCGKCNFCREGLIQLHMMEKEITDGKGKAEYPDMIKEIGEAMVFSTPCTMGQTGSDFALGSIEYFMSEYDAHIKKKNCPANKCNSFMTIYIDPNTCEGCEECADVCPADCIEGKAGFIHMIDEYDCTKCGKCIEACENDAIIQTTGRVPKLPTRLVKCGKFKKR